MTGDSSNDPRAVEEALRNEVDELGRVDDEQQRTIARLERELQLHSAALGWRLQLRLEPLRRAMLATPILRQIYRVLYRALDLWVDAGLSTIARQVRHKIGRALRGRSFLVEARQVRPPTTEEQYQEWIRRYGQSPEAHTMRSWIAQFRSQPLVSVLAAMHTTDTEQMRRLTATLQAQGYERWELCLAVPRRVRATLGEQLSALQRAEPRLRLADVDDTATVAASLAVASGDLVGVLDAGDELAPEALLELVRRFGEQPRADIVYSDEDWIEPDGRRHDPLFKPDWSPDLLLSVNYLACLGLFRRDLVDRVGGFRAGAGRAGLYDLVLRMTEASQAVAHVPKVLCHRRSRAATVDAALDRRATGGDECHVIEEALARRGRVGTATAVFARRGTRGYSTRVELRDRPLVSIVIPSKNNRALLATTIDSIRARTEYDRYEILVVDNGSTDPDAVEYLKSPPEGCQVFRWNQPFNYSAINNFGVRHASGSQVLFLNDDVEVIRPDWMTAMLEHAQRDEVGAVGARLLYADGRIQHAGVVVGINRAAANAFRSAPGQSTSLRLADLTRNCSAVTGACMMVPRRVFEEVGGFDEELRVVLNDVDLCLRIRQKGLLVVYTPHALLYHYEGSSRGLLHPPPDQRRFEEKWGKVLASVDPYYNPNLTDDRDDWSLKIEH